MMTVKDATLIVLCVVAFIWMLSALRKLPPPEF